MAHKAYALHSSVSAHAPQHLAKEHEKEVRYVRISEQITGITVPSVGVEKGRVAPKLSARHGT